MHREIAARNVLVYEGNHLKLNDFSLAPKLTAGAQSWKMDRVGRLPIRYMPPEAFTEQTFSQASDVWSFGVLQWEMMTCASLSSHRNVYNEHVAGGVTFPTRARSPRSKRWASMCAQATALQRLKLVPTTHHGKQFANLCPNR